jgi:hypothetical protein
MHLWRSRASDESDVDILLAAISHKELSGKEAFHPVVHAEGGSLVPPTNFAGHGMVEVARLSKTFPFQASAPAQPSAPLHRGPRLRTHTPHATPSLHPPHSLRTIRPERGLPATPLLLPSPDPLSDSVRAFQANVKCDQMHFPTAKAHTDLWYERPAVAKANDRAHKRRLLAFVPPMTAEAALCAAAAAGLVKVRGRSSVAQRLGGVYGTGGPTTA